MKRTFILLACLFIYAWSGTLSAQIFYQDIVPDHVQSTWGFRSVHIDSIATATLSMSGNGVLNIWSEFGTRTALKSFADCEVMLTNGYPSALYLNDQISPSGTWVLPNYAILFDGSVGNWAGAVDQYLGVRVKNGNDWLYGWIRMDVNTAGNVVTIKDYACNRSPNSPIAAGQTQGAAATYSTVTVSSCGPYTSPSGNYTWSVSATYQDTILNAAGGDSVMTINLTVLPVYSDSTSVSSCGPYISPSGTIISSSGNYADTLASVDGCDSILFIDLDVTIIDTTVTQSGSTLTSNAAGAVSYQWVECDNNFAPISGATGPTFAAMQDGVYAVIITDGSCSDTSACIPVTGTGLSGSVEIPEVILYPNPASEFITLQFREPQTDLVIEVCKLDGRLLHSGYYRQLQVCDISVRDWTPGCYLVTIRSSQVLIFRKVIVQPPH